MRKLSIAAASAILVTASMFGLAHAADPAAPAAAPAPHDMHRMHEDHMRGPWGLSDVRKLHDQLKLNPQQEQAWQQATARAKQNHDAMRKNGEQFKSMAAAAKDQKILDLAGMRAQRDKVFEESRRLRNDTEDQWLAVYNGLNDGQKEMVSTAIKARFAKMEAWREKRMERHGARNPAQAPAAGQAGQ
ncbi:hypothetical protein PTE30175_01276 [Pandoraea terrae]|uniref:Periplasmic heavy metal sensor n=1 Tax=Pandoraea terrae TaxID=1537710 RepID=A0A5E4TGW9_9BURK|nr:Spy/CpxP family protein refolding chaperone [Pandoraea terrae]VVD85409.1 hypothetical protein PTE30175_01276 [Pandoraea terrae]